MYVPLCNRGVVVSTDISKTSSSPPVSLSTDSIFRWTGRAEQVMTELEQALDGAVLAEGTVQNGSKLKNKEGAKGCQGDSPVQAAFGLSPTLITFGTLRAQAAGLHFAHGLHYHQN